MSEKASDFTQKKTFREKSPQMLKFCIRRSKMSVCRVKFCLCSVKSSVCYPFLLVCCRNSRKDSIQTRKLVGLFTEIKLSFAKREFCSQNRIITDCAGGMNSENLAER